MLNIKPVSPSRNSYLIGVAERVIKYRFFGGEFLGEVAVAREIVGSEDSKSGVVVPKFLLPNFYFL